MIQPRLLAFDLDVLRVKQLFVSFPSLQVVLVHLLSGKAKMLA